MSTARGRIAKEGSHFDNTAGMPPVVSPIEITRVASRAERNAFIKFPFRIYAHDPVWVPPLLLERKEFLNREKTPILPAR